MYNDYNIKLHSLVTNTLECYCTLDIIPDACQMLVSPNAQWPIVLRKASGLQRSPRRVLHEGQTIVVELVIRQQQTLVSIVARLIDGDLFLLDRVQMLDVIVPGFTFALQICGERDLLDRWIFRFFAVLIAIENDGRAGLRDTA